MTTRFASSALIPQDIRRQFFDGNTRNAAAGTGEHGRSQGRSELEQTENNVHVNPLNETEIRCEKLLAFVESTLSKLSWDEKLKTENGGIFLGIA